MSIYRSDLLDFITQKNEKKSMSPTVDFIDKAQGNSTYPAVENSEINFMDANAFTFLRENIMGMLPELAMLIEEQQILRLKEKDDKISLLKTQMDQMEFLLMSDFSPLDKEPVTFPKDLSKLEQCIPNPFSKTTTVNCFVPSSVVNAVLTVLTIAGKKVKSIVIEERGNVQLELDSAGMSSGTFIYQLVADNQIKHSKEMEFLK